MESTLQAGFRFQHPVSFYEIQLAGGRVSNTQLKAIEGAFSKGPDDFSSLDQIINEVGITADMLNYLARVLESKSLNLSCVLYHVVFASDPSHPYAGANFAIALHKLGHEDAAREIAAQALESNELSEWGKNALMQENLTP